ncbi:MAG: uroporphyrinogen decarboxylase [Clostridia bacterium]|nr:uroporphyrinogen decarboxylase [Clostridia bacterium]
MNRRERLQAVINGQEHDRTPVSTWMHFSEHDQDPRSLAEAMVAYNERYDYDFIKMMPFGAYTVQDWGAKLAVYCDKYKEVEIAAPAISELEDYLKIEPLAPTFGTWGKTLLLSQYLSKLTAANTPYIQTIFSPLTTLKKMTSGRLLEDMKENPGFVHQALSAITETTISFVKANIEAGVSGFFFATQCATYDYLTDELFAEFCKPYDYKVINAYKDETWFNVVHIHGANIMFDTVSKYPCNVINWHDRYTEPSLAEAREKCSKVFMGGLREIPTIVGSKLHYESVLAQEDSNYIKNHVKEAIAMVDGKGLIVGPGCVVDPRASDENLRAVREAVER